jgi:Asp/Glu/hydantoin racemase
MPVRIGVVAPMLITIDPMGTAFAEIWPEAQHLAIADETLYADFAGGKPITEETYKRVSDLLHYAATTRCDGLVFTGSVFGDPVDKARQDIDIPVLASYEAMIEEAFAAGTRFAILSTAPGSMKNLSADLEAEAARRGVAITIDGHVAAEARPPILAGDIETHDRIVVEAAARMTDCDCLMFAQVSMGLTAKQVAPGEGRPVLTAPEATVRKFKAMLG